jgi:hypothetical protein
VHRGAPEREHEQRPLGEGAQRPIHVAHGGQVAPVQVLEHEDHRVGLALVGEEVLERTLHLVAHEPRVLARSGQLHAVGGLERHAHELAEELGHALPHGRGHSQAHALQHLELAPLDGLALVHAEQAVQGRGEQAERGAGPHRVAARDDDGGAGIVRFEPAQQLVAEPRLSHAGRAGDEDHLRARLGHTRLVERLEQPELHVAAHTRGGAAEQRAHGRVGVALAREQQALGVATHHEAGLDERGGGVVESNGGGRGRGVALPQQQHGPIDDLAHRQAPGDHAAAGGHRHAHAG